MARLSGEKPQQQRLLDEEAGRSDEGETSSVGSVDASWNTHQSQQSKGPKRWFYQVLNLPRRYRFLVGLAIVLTILVIWATPYRPAFDATPHHSESSGKTHTYSHSDHVTTHQTSTLHSAASATNPAGAKVDSPSPVGSSAAEKSAQPGKDAGNPTYGERVMPWRNETMVSPEHCTTWPLEDDGSYIFPPKPSQPLKLTSYAPAGGWKKPKDVKVVAMVFYGRLRAVDILDCYLQQNLASNGGVVDEVWFMVHTTIKEDVEWLKELTDSVDGYRFYDLGDETIKGYGYIWEHAIEDKTIYIKIDDDIVSSPSQKRKGVLLMSLCAN
jgi:hypothetical protein